MLTSRCVTRICKFLTVSFLSLALFSCGGGGGAGDPVDPIVTLPPAAPTATVTVLLTDAPSDLFQQIFVTITAIELLGGDERVLLFAGEETIDILALENFADLFAIADDVPAGQYSKIRLTIADLELVRLDDAGNVVESIHPNLPGNGKLDLNPRGTFEIAPGENVLLQLDIDARRSIHIVGTGSGSYRFRPVIFVDVLNDGLDGKSARVSGEIVAIDASDQSFELCQRRPSSSQSSNDQNQRHCVIVKVSDQTGLFDENADAISFADLMLNDTVTAIGHFDGNNASDRAVLDAIVVARGANDRFRRFDGTILGAPDAANRFGFLLGAGQGFDDGSIVEVQLQAGTGIADEDGALVGADQIQADVRAEVEGLLMLSSADPDTLRAIYLVLDIDVDDDMDDDDEVRISGDILTIAEASNSLTIATDAGDRCINLNDDSRLFLITTSGGVSTTDDIDLADVPLGAPVDLYGEERVDGCFEATAVLIFSPT